MIIGKISLLLIVLTILVSNNLYAQGWAGDRMLDANGVLKVLADVMGPAAPGETYSTANTINWSVSPKFQIQRAYQDFGGNCDPDNPSSVITNEAVDPPFTHSNGRASTVSQNGTYSACDDKLNSKNDFTPKALLTRAAWSYRLCRLISVRSSSLQIAMMAERVRSNDPVLTTTSTPLVALSTAVSDGPAPTPNWCNMITAPTRVDLGKLFRAFYPGRVIPQAEKIVSTDTPVRFSNQRQVNYAFEELHEVYYTDTLIDLIAQSNTFLDTASVSSLNGLESRCIPDGPYASKDKIKALNAWRAVFMTMCMDPGWQVL